MKQTWVVVITDSKGGTVELKFDSELTALRFYVDMMSNPPRNAYAHKPTETGGYNVV